VKKDSLDIWEKHWSGTQKNQESLAGVFGPSLPKARTINRDDIKELILDSSPVVEKSERQEIAKEKVTEKKSKKNLEQLEKDILKRKKKAETNTKQKSNESNTADIKVQPKYINKKSSEDLAAYAIEPNLEKRKTYLKIGCDLKDVYVYLDGKKVGKTPLKKKLPVSSGWHRIRIDVPGAKKFNQSGIPTPDFRDVYVTKGRTQKVTFKFLNKTEEPG
jgi:PEGA domain.